MSPAPTPDLAGLSKALRSGAGCELVYTSALSAAEREACALRLAKANSGAEFGVDPDKRAAFDAAAERAKWFQQPFLAMDPKNGCRPKITRRDIRVQGAEWKVAIACGISF